MDLREAGMCLAQGCTIALITSSRLKRFHKRQEWLWLLGQLPGAVVNFVTGLWFYFVWSLVLAGISVYHMRKEHSRVDTSPLP